jgi:hypothetical protein
MRHCGLAGIGAFACMCLAVADAVASTARAVAPAASDTGVSLETGTLALLGAGLVGLALSQIFKRRS